MKKNKIVIISIISIIILLAIIYYFTLYNNNTSTTNNISLYTEDEEIDWTKYKENNLVLDKTITIEEEGIYNLSGNIDNGLIIINTKGNIKLNLNNVTITNEQGPALYIENAKNVIINTKKNTVSTFTNGKSYIDTYKDIDAVIYSKDNLILEGSGTLKVKSNIYDAIVSKDNLKINSGTYEITSQGDALKGKDSVYIKDGVFNITTEQDGIKSTNDEDSTKGYIKILKAKININSKSDAIQAETKLLITDGTFNITTQSTLEENNDIINEDTTSSKGLKASDNIIIEGGTYNLDTYDDSIHSNNSIEISNSKIEIKSSDDAIHADSNLIINSGNINITNCYEGLESEVITINDGNINIVASDDGLNSANDTDGNIISKPGTTTKTNSKIVINGGSIYIDAKGDGVDSNGSIVMNDGELIIEGPTSNGNGSIDYENEFNMIGGTLTAIGSIGMAQGISETSKQYGIIIYFDQTISSGKTISILNSNNKEIYSYTSSKEYSSFVYSSNKLEKDKKYIIKIDDEEYESFTITNISTEVGSKIQGYNNQDHEKDIRNTPPDNHRK